MVKVRQSVSTKNTLIQKASTQTFIAVALASVVVSMSLVILNILWGNAGYNNKVHDAQEATRDTLEANIAVIDDLETAFQNLDKGADLISDQDPEKSNAEVVLDALPTRYDFPELAASLENLAIISSVELRGISGEDIGSDAVGSSPQPVPDSIPFTVDVAGEYVEVLKFIKGMETSIRPIKVTSISLGGTTDNLQVSISAETSYQPAFDLTIQTERVSQ